jgi:HME family heavy-metal exporter
MYLAFGRTATEKLLASNPEAEGTPEQQEAF